MLKDQNAELCRDTGANTGSVLGAGWPHRCCAVSTLFYYLVLLFWTSSAWAVTSSVKYLFPSSDELAFPVSHGRQCFQDLCAQNSTAFQFDRIWKRIYDPQSPESYWLQKVPLLRAWAPLRDLGSDPERHLNTRLILWAVQLKPVNVMRLMICLKLSLLSTGALWELALIKVTLISKSQFWVAGRLSVRTL